MESLEYSQPLMLSKTLDNCNKYLVVYHVANKVTHIMYNRSFNHKPVFLSNTVIAASIENHHNDS